MKILAIETSCDETSLALLECSGPISHPQFKILKHFVASQIKIHEPFGGVVPNLAKREHLINLPVLYKKIFGVQPEINGKENAKPGFRLSGRNDRRTTEKRLWKQIKFIAVTSGPGLEPALWTGIEFAKSLGKTHKVPVYGANHMEGHLWSFLASKSGKTAVKAGLKKQFPAVALLVSGGHTILLKMTAIDKWKKLGETRDDAVGEAFDKVARILKLPYPGGPQIEKLAKLGNEDAILFPRPMIHDKNFDFSYSGLKTSVLYFVRDNQNAKPEDIAASFQKAAVDVLVAKTKRAAKESKAKSVIIAGGVASSKYLRKALQAMCKELKVKLFVPEHKLNTDNAGMIGIAGYMNHLRGKKHSLKANGAMNI